VVYQNKSKKNSAYGGDYKNYLRFIVPNQAQLISIAIDGVSQPLTDAVIDPKIFEAASFKPAAGIEVEKTEESGKQLFGLLVNVPAESKKEVRITYSVPMVALSQSLSSTYSLQVFKQPGTEADPYLCTVNYPPQFALIKKPNAVNVANGKVTWLTDLSEDRTMTLQLTKR
jgi:hypothetical protein